MLSELGKFEGGSRLFSPLPGREILLERIDPPIQLLVFGAGEDAIPVTQFAKNLGWKVKVYDGRAHYAKPERFPQADSVELRPLGSPAPVIDKWTAAITMTHSFSQDADVLRSLAERPIRYLGVLGPRKRTGQLLAETELSSLEANPALHAPMGLDVGTDGPEQVALAIIAEIQSVMNGRPAGLLRDRPGPIHSGEAVAHDDASPEHVWVRSIVCA
jgi:xanthine/CO dehydrogenase XdhC/CoxF family maturation factor